MLKFYEIILKMIILGLPLYLLRIRYDLFRTNLIEFLIIIAFIIWFFLHSQSQAKKIFAFLTREKLFSLGLIALIYGLTMSIIFSQDKLTSLGIVKGWFLIPIIFFIIISFSKIKFDPFLYLAISGLAVAIISIFYLMADILTYDLRLKAFYLHPNHLAMYLAPAFLIFLIKFLKTKKKNYLYFSLPIFFVIFFTKSFGTLMAIFSSLFIYFLMKKNDKKFLKIFLLFILASFIIFTQLNKDKIKDIFETNRSSFHSRIIIWQVASKIIKDHPLIGIGPGAFQKVYLDYQKFYPPYLEWAVPQPHNIFLAFLVQTGIFGLAGFILILIWFYRKIFNFKFSILNLTAFSLMNYTLIHGLVDTTYWKNDLAVIFWLLISSILLQLKTYGSTFKE